MPCTSVSDVPPQDPKMDPFWGCYPGPLERVFNKTRSLAQSLYARARIGIVYRGSKYPILDPLDTPDPNLDPSGSGQVSTS